MRARHGGQAWRTRKRKSRSLAKSASGCIESKHRRLAEGEMLSYKGKAASSSGCVERRNRNPRGGPPHSKKAIAGPSLKALRDDIQERKAADSQKARFCATKAKRVRGDATLRVACHGRQARAQRAAPLRRTTADSSSSLAHNARNDMCWAGARCSGQGSGNWRRHRSGKQVP